MITQLPTGESLTPVRQIAFLEKRKKSPQRPLGTSGRSRACGEFVAPSQHPAVGVVKAVVIPVRLGVGRLIHALTLASVTLTGGILNGLVLVLGGSTYLLPDRRPSSEKRPQYDHERKTKTA